MYAGYFHNYRNEDIIRAAFGSDSNAQGSLGPVPQGYCWYIERYTTRVATTAGVITAATPLCEVAVLSDQAVSVIGTWDRAGRQDYTANGKNDISDNESPLYAGPGQYLVAVWTTANSGEIAVLSCQIRVHQLEPYPLVPSDYAQLLEASAQPVMLEEAPNI